jgi:hypothetical protein
MKFEAATGTAAEKIAAIAKAEGVCVDTIRNSIKEINAFRSRNTATEMDFAIRDLVISTVPYAKETLVGLLNANSVLEYTDPKTQKKTFKKVEDKTTRLEAVRLVKDIIIGLQPKQAPVEVNVQQTNQVANLSTAETTEERMRRLRLKAQEHNLLPPEVAAVPASIDRGDDEDDDEEEDGEDDE